MLIVSTKGSENLIRSLEKQIVFFFPSLSLSYVLACKFSLHTQIFTELFFLLAKKFDIL